MIKHLTKAIEMEGHLGFNRKFRGKHYAHLMEVGFNDYGRFIRISEFATKRRFCCLMIPEGEEGSGWENIRRALSSMLVVPSANTVEKGRQHRGEGSSQILWVPYIGLLRKWSVVKDQEKVALFLSGDGRVQWCVNALRIGLTGLSTDEKMVAEGKCGNRGEIQRRLDRITGLPFHLWSEQGEGKNRNERKVSPTGFTRGDRWGVGVYSCRRSGRRRRLPRGSVKGESTREAFASNTGTGGGRREEKIRSTAGGRCRVEEDNRRGRGKKRYGCGCCRGDT
ncbi:hypothetical protein CK203_089441 [Vitis vinifera]|uniref:DUF4283 domain-containing protein n=1 Tax=Vitis vinifera TaxID=29760 RepID=A0A438E977_VITVI|nr:hypothetical protein CK203_089441 [Vitis vinifera]